MYAPGSRRNMRAPPVTLNHPLSRAISILLICHRCLNNFKYFSIASGSRTVSMGGSTLYSRVKTSQPISPCEYSSIRASRRRRTSTGSWCALDERIAVSRFAVKLWRYRVLAGLVKLGLHAISEVEFDHRYRRANIPKCLHQLVSKVTVTKQKKVFESQQVIKQFKFFNKDFE